MIRGQDTVGKAQQLRLRVKELMGRREGSLPILPPAGGEVSVVQKVSSTLQALVCRIMLLKPNIHDCELHIKYFLSCFELFDKAMRKSTDIPSWITSYNFKKICWSIEATMEWLPLQLAQKCYG